MDPVRVASIGLGRRGSALAATATATGPEVTTCFARTPATRQEFTAEHGCEAAESCEQVLADDRIDAVLLVMPHSTHEPLVSEAAAAGKRFCLQETGKVVDLDEARART